MINRTSRPATKEKRGAGWPGFAATLVVLATITACGGGSSGGGALGIQAQLPTADTDFAFIAVHDPSSADYDSDCISCHGDRMTEVALDGVTPSVHSTMAGSALFGEGNARCLFCHKHGANLVNESGSGLRRQVDMFACNVCHGAGLTIPFYQ